MIVPFVRTFLLTKCLLAGFSNTCSILIFEYFLALGSNTLAKESVIEIVFVFPPLPLSNLTALSPSLVIVGSLANSLNFLVLRATYLPPVNFLFERACAFAIEFYSEFSIFKTFFLEKEERKLVKYLKIYPWMEFKGSTNLSDCGLFIELEELAQEDYSKLTFDELEFYVLHCEDNCPSKNHGLAHKDRYMQWLDDCLDKVGFPSLEELERKRDESIQKFLSMGKFPLGGNSEEEHSILEEKLKHDIMEEENKNRPLDDRDCEYNPKKTLLVRGYLVEHELSS